MKLPPPPGTFGAYLFDCDGTIADSMPLHYIAWKQALTEWNCDFGEMLFYSWGGRPVAEIIASLNQQHGLAMPVAEVAHRKECLYFELLPQLKAVPEVLEHIQARYGQIPFAVVSGSTRDSVVASAAYFGCRDAVANAHRRHLFGRAGAAHETRIEGKEVFLQPLGAVAFWINGEIDDLHL